MDISIVPTFLVKNVCLVDSSLQSAYCCTPMLTEHLSPAVRKKVDSTWRCCWKWSIYLDEEFRERSQDLMGSIFDGCYVVKEADSLHP